MRTWSVGRRLGWLGVGWVSWVSVGAVGGRLGQSGCRLPPTTDPNRHRTDPTDGQPTMSTWCAPISRVLNPFPASVCPSSNVLGPVSGRKHGHLAWVTTPKRGQNLDPNRPQPTPTDTQPTTFVTQTDTQPTTFVTPTDTQPTVDRSWANILGPWGPIPCGMWG